MPRLIDDIARHGLALRNIYEGVPPNIASALRNFVRVAALKILAAEVVVADNVSDYYYQGNDKEDWVLTEDFPNVAPIFNPCWIEWRVPHTSVSKEKGTVTMPPGAKSGVYLDFIESGTINSNRDYQAFGALIDKRHFDKYKWICMASSVSCLDQLDHGKPILSPVLFSFGVEENGRPGLINGAVQMPNVGGDFMLKGQMEIYQQHGVGDLFVGLLTLSFCHCRNVAMHSIPHSPKLEKAYKRRTGLDLFKYHLLEIEPMKKVLDAERTKGQSLQHALHICRGHFKDYHEHGLFGKLKGMYWWNMTLRGNPDHGVVMKDYKVGDKKIQQGLG